MLNSKAALSSYDFSTNFDGFVWVKQSGVWIESGRGATPITKYEVKSGTNYLNVNI